MYGRKKDEKKSGFFTEIADGLFEFSHNLSKGAFEPPVWAEGKKPSEEKMKMIYHSTGEKNVLEAIENKSSKFGFETAIRFVYIDKKDEFTQLNVAAVTGAFKQFGTQDRNSFKSIKETRTHVTDDLLTYKSWFRKGRIYARKRAIYDKYRNRAFPDQSSILCTEELATVYHFPITSVEAPMLRRLQTRKGEPPSTLPM